MQHTIAAVFNNQSQAQQACDALISAGFPREEVHLSQSEATGEVGRSSAAERDQHDESLGSSIKSFFADLFGSHNPRDADLYSDAVMQGNYVLTVNVPDDDQVDQAAEVLDHYHPLDVQDQESDWKSGGWAAADSMRQSSASDTLQRQAGSDAAGFSQSASGTQSTPTIQEELDLGQGAGQQRSGVRVFPRSGESTIDNTANLRDEPLFMDNRLTCRRQTSQRRKRVEPPNRLRMKTLAATVQIRLSLMKQASGSNNSTTRSAVPDQTHSSFPARKRNPVRSTRITMRFTEATGIVTMRRALRRAPMMIMNRHTGMDRPYRVATAIRAGSGKR